MRRSALALVVLVACGDPAAVDRSPRQVRVSLAVATGAATGFFQGPFVSVADKVSLAVTGSDGETRTFGARLARRDTTVAFQMALPEGPAQFDARVLSATSTLLFAGTQSTTVTPAGFTVRLRTAPVAPVLLVAPDTLALSTGPNGASGTLGLYNRGAGTLTATIDSSQVPQTCRGACVTFVVPRTGLTVPAGGAIAVGIRGFLPTPPFTVTFGSAQGSVPVVLMVR